jgi:hypothetical protein
MQRQEQGIGMGGRASQPTKLNRKVDGFRGSGVKGHGDQHPQAPRHHRFMSWDFTEDAAFMALCDAYKESGETSAMEFLAHGEGAFHFQELTQNAAGEGIDLSDSADLEEFQQEVIDTLQEMCS